MFLFVFTVGMAAERATIRGQSSRPIAIGSVLMVLVFAVGHVRGGQYNPAVSTAVLLRGRMKANRYVAFVVTQFVAACSADGSSAGSAERRAGATASTGKMLVVELLFTFALAYVVLNVATAKGTRGRLLLRARDRLTVIVGAISVGWISGGAFNPAIALGATIFGASLVAHLDLHPCRTGRRRPAAGGIPLHPGRTRQGGMTPG